METINEGLTTAPNTAGAWLKQARQQRGLHIAALAVMLKVPQAKLEALEADRWADLPDATFGRALATAVCRALKVDPSPMLGLLPAGRGPALNVSPGLNQPFRERGGLEDGVALLARPVVWGPLLLLLAAGAIYWFPAGWVPTTSPAPAPAQSAASAVLQAASASPVEFVSAPLAAPAVEPAGLSASAPAVPASAPLAVPGAAPLALSTPAASLAGEALRVSASAPSWIEVVDARGQVLLSRQLRAGESQDLSGAAPLKLRVGNVSGTAIEWRGAAVNLAERATNNVARLELN